VRACQRPILTEGGAITLSAADSEALLGEVGIPVDREDEVRPGISATQLWPTLNPVLQKLRHEVQQSLTHSPLHGAHNAGLSLLGAPALPGLAEFLADELQLEGPLVPLERTETCYLAALSGHDRKQASMDLRPPEEQLGDRLTKPALVAGLCALLVILANSAAPREAGARLAGLRPLAERLGVQLEHAQHQRADAEQTCFELAGQVGRRIQLAKTLPPDVPIIGLLKEALGSVPPNMELVDVQFDANAVPAVLGLRAGYRGDVAASVVAAQWARDLSDSVFFSGAKVTTVSGSGREVSAFLEIKARLK
jgi:hypothetical protein